MTSIRRSGLTDLEELIVNNMDMENIKKWLKIAAIFVYCFIAVIASAGAMNRGYETHEWIYFVAGVVNLILATYMAFREYKKSQEG